MYVPSWIALLVNAICNGLVVLSVQIHIMYVLASLVYSLLV